MITQGAKLSIRTLPLDCIQVKEYQVRYPEKLSLYIQLLQEHPWEHAGLLSVTPSGTHGGMYTLLDGHHRFCAAIMAGRKDALCIIVEEPLVANT
jgi:ParB-like chromosome segregation protein Spo0J